MQNQLNDIFSSILSRSDQEAKQTQLYSNLLQEPDLFDNYDNFYFAHIRPNQKVFEQALIEVKVLAEHPKKYEYVDVFLHGSDYYQPHLREIFQKLEGSFGCADKAKRMIMAYLMFLRTGEISAWDKECYSVPSKGDPIQWFGLMHALYMFKFGKSDDYFECYSKIKDLYAN